MTRVLLVTPDKSEVLDTTITLPHLRTLIGGGYLEAIYGWHPNGEWCCYIDEEGKLKGLPVNQPASMLAAQAGWPGAMSDYLCGPAVFVGPTDDEGYDTEVPQWLIEEARTVGSVSDKTGKRGDAT
jgi:hypothetical protein